MGKRVVAIDLDPQANLTSAFLRRKNLRNCGTQNCFRPKPRRSTDACNPSWRWGYSGTDHSAYLLLFTSCSRDLALAGFEDFLSQEWPNSLGSGKSFARLPRVDSFLDCRSKSSRATSSRSHSCRCWPEPWGHQSLCPHRLRLCRDSLSCRPLFAARPPQSGAYPPALALGLEQAPEQLDARLPFHCRRAKWSLSVTSSSNIAKGSPDP